MDLPFSFKHKTLLLVEGFENPQLKPARGIIQAEGDKSNTKFICNLTNAPIKLESGESVGEASLCSKKLSHLQRIDLSNQGEVYNIELSTN